MESMTDEHDLERTVVLHDGTAVWLRAIRSDDDTGLVALFHRLGEQTIYQRFFAARRSLPPLWIHVLTHVDYQRRLAIVAELDDASGPRLIGVARYVIVATGHTARLLQDKVGLDVEAVLSGPEGGDAQIAARVATGGVDTVFFFVDPLEAQPHDPDIRALLRVCNVHNVPVATNLATADLIIAALMR